MKFQEWLMHGSLYVNSSRLAIAPKSHLLSENEILRTNVDLFLKAINFRCVLNLGIINLKWN